MTLRGFVSPQMAGMTHDRPSHQSLVDMEGGQKDDA